MIIRFLSFCLLLTICSCIKPIDLELEDGEEKLALFSTLRADSLVVITLVKERSNGSNTSNVYVSNADVSITSNGELSKFFYRGPDETGLTHGVYMNETFRPTVEQVYELSVKVDGFDELTSSCILPAPVEFGNIQAEDFYRDWIDPLNPSNNKLKEVTVVGSYQITGDPAAIRNHYYLATADIWLDWFSEDESGNLVFYHNKEVVQNLPIQNIESENPAYTSLGFKPGFLIDDRLLQSSTTSRISFQFSFILDPRFQELNHLTLNLGHCEKAFFEFHRLAARQVELEGDPFGSGVVITTNIDNGFGYFSGYSTGQADFNFPPN